MTHHYDPSAVIVSSLSKSVARLATVCFSADKCNNCARNSDACRGMMLHRIGLEKDGWEVQDKVMPSVQGYKQVHQGCNNLDFSPQVLRNVERDSGDRVKRLLLTCCLFFYFI